MTIRIPFMPDLPRPRPITSRVITIASIAALLSFTLFIDTEVIAVVAAIVWSVSTTLQLPLAIGAVLAALLAVPALWTCIAVAIMAYDAGTDPANNLN